MSNKNMDTKLSVNFTKASTKQNITSGENISTSFGKISKYLDDLGSAAFTDSSDYATLTALGNKVDKVTGKELMPSDLLDANGNIALSHLPDIVLGQMIYGGTVNASNVATLSSNAKTKLGTTSNTITLTNNTASITGYAANEGIYYIATGNATLANLGIKAGDWLLSTGSAWSKIDNTDEVSSVNNKTGAVILNASDVSAVSTSANQGLTDTEKANARTNIGAGTSSFDGNYNSLNNKPTIPAAVAVKGNAETSYRTGNVNLTPANIGAATSAQGTKADSAVQTIQMNGNTVTKTNGVVNLGTVITAHQDISGKADKSATVSNITYDTTNKKLTKTINGTTTDVVTTAKLKTDMALSKSDVGLGNVGNFKAVSTIASQGLNDTEKANARANIGAGTSSFSGSYNDLSNKPTIPTVNNGTLTIQKNGTNVATFTANQSGNSTANITVPTKVSELTNDSGYTTNTGTVTQVKVGSTAYNPSSGVISLPAYPTDTNTHRPIQLNGTEILGNNTTALNLKAGSNVSMTNSNGTVTINATDTNTNYYHTTGSWSGLTYTATANGGAGALAFTIPTGTTDTTVAVGNHTHSATSITSAYESKLLWGGNNITYGFGPIDAAMIGELGANRLCFIPGSAVTVEYSRDGGSTWTDYSANNATKTALFSNGSGLYIGKADSNNKATANTDKYQLRITIDTGAGNVYSTLNKFVFLISTNGSSNCTVTLQIALQSSPTSFTTHASMSIQGWPGYNILNCGDFVTYGNSSASQYGRIRFIFKANGGNTNYIGLNVQKIMAFGGVGWTTPSTMAKTGHLYSFDAYQNASFPATVTATSFNGDGSNLTNLNASNISSGTLAKERLATSAQIDYNTNQGVKNLCKITAESQTMNGVTFTVDKAAGTITANGTATALAFFKIGDYMSSILQVGNKYTLSGCPAGGNYTSTYALYVFNAGTSSTVWTDVGLSGGSSYVIPSDIRLSPLYILIRPGVTVSNIVFKPMIRDASIKDDTFEPHAEPNYQLTQKIDRALEQTGYNLFEITADTQTTNGVTFTVDKAAGTITTNGTATGAIWFTLYNASLPVGKYTLSGCPPNGSLGTYSLVLYDSSSESITVDTGEGNTFSTNATEARLIIRIGSGATLSNLVFKPMIVPAELTGVPFQTYAEPSYRLTQKIDRALEQTGYNLFEITADTQTTNGVTFTVDKAAGTITVNGTATAQAALVVGQQNIPFNYAYQYTISGLPSGSETTYFFNLETSQSKNYNIYIDQSLNLDKDIYPSVITRALIYIRKGQTVSNLVFKPMIVPAELAGLPFQPYAMSNAELTQQALIKEDDNAGGYVVDLDKDCKLQRNSNYIRLRNNSINIHTDSSSISLQCGTTGSPLRGVSITSTAVRMYFGLNTLTVDEDGLWFNNTKIAE